MLEKQTDMRYDVKFACLDTLVPTNHLLRKIENAVDFTKVYSITEHLYRDDFGRPAVDPVDLTTRRGV